MPLVESLTTQFVCIKNCMLQFRRHKRQKRLEVVQASIETDAKAAIFVGAVVRVVSFIPRSTESITV
jgi:hypothetical protein